MWFLEKALEVVYLSKCHKNVDVMLVIPACIWVERKFCLHYRLETKNGLKLTHPLPIQLSFTAYELCM